MGSGGGGSSGEVDYPDYMKTWHGQALVGGVNLDMSVTDALNAAFGNSPYTGSTAYDPDADITAWEAALADFQTMLAGVPDPNDWAALFAIAETEVGPIEAELVADINAFSDILDDDVTTKVLPRYQAAMRDINAVVSSSFAIGTAIIEGFRTRDVAKYGTTLRIQANTEMKKIYLGAVDQMIKLMSERVQWEDTYVKTFIEAKRIKIVAKKEETEANLKIDEADALWDLELFKYGGNMLASIAGTAIQTGAKGPSQAQSAIGGALSGAAAGAMIGAKVGAAGGPLTAVSGGVIGGILGLAGGLF